MNDRDFGRIVFGAVLACIGVALLLDRTGMMRWTDQWSLWPFLLIAYGVARIAQAPDEAPRHSMWILVGAWLLAGEAGWLSLRETWPLMIVAYGLTIVWQSFIPEPVPDPAAVPVAPAAGEDPLRYRRRLRRMRYRRRGSPLMILVLIGAITVALRVESRRNSGAPDSGGGPHIVSVLGETRRAPIGPLERAEITTVLGGTELDLRSATIEPGHEATVDVVGFMGGTTIRVPRGWIVDLQADSALGTAADRRQRLPGDWDAAGTTSSAGTGVSANAVQTAPRLIVRGFVMMGEIAIR